MLMSLVLGVRALICNVYEIIIVKEIPFYWNSWDEWHPGQRLAGTLPGCHPIIQLPYPVPGFGWCWGTYSGYWCPWMHPVIRDIKRPAVPCHSGANVWKAHFQIFILSPLHPCTLLSPWPRSSWTPTLGRPSYPPVNPKYPECRSRKQISI